MYLFYRGHVPQTIGQLAQFFDSMGQPNWEFFGKELRGTEKCSYSSDDQYDALPHIRVKAQTCRRFLPELDHLPQAHTCCGERGVVGDGIHQHIGLFPRHLEAISRPFGLLERAFKPMHRSEVSELVVCSRANQVKKKERRSGDSSVSMNHNHDYYRLESGPWSQLVTFPTRKERESQMP